MCERVQHWVSGHPLGILNVPLTGTQIISTKRKRDCLNVSILKTQPSTWKQDGYWVVTYRVQTVLSKEVLSKPGQNETALDLFALLKATNHGCAQDFLWVYLSRESRKSVKHPLAWQTLNDPHSFSSVPLIGCRQIQNLWVLSTFNMSWLCSSTVNQNHGKQSCRSNIVLKSSPQSLLHPTQNLPTKSNPNSSIHLHDVGPFSHAAHTHVTWDKKKRKERKKCTFNWYHNLKEKRLFGVVRSVLYATEEKEIFVFVRNRDQSKASQQKPDTVPRRTNQTRRFGHIQSIHSQNGNRVSYNKQNQYKQEANGCEEKGAKEMILININLTNCGD